VGGKLVGVRFFHETGEPSFETPLKDGVYHGTVYRWDIPGQLLSSEPYVNGKPHGVARQWSDDFNLAQVPAVGEQATQKVPARSGEILSAAKGCEMTPEPRPYRDPSDLEKMRQLLIEGRRANNGTYYVHAGDLNWWLFYPPQKFSFSDNIYLWDEGGEVNGWALFSEGDRTVDVFFHPDLRSTEQAEAMCTWAEEWAMVKAKGHGHKNIRRMWVFETDEFSTSHLRRRGFANDKHKLVYMRQTLSDSIPAPQLPDGYAVRPVAGEAEVHKRAAASHGAFGSRMPFEQYWPRYFSFMQSRVYEADRDVVAVAPDGRFAAFCIFWLDAVNKVGLFEPVGTHPDFQRQGLGKAVMLEGLRRMKVRGMESAIVCAEDDNVAAIKLYESIGFRVANKLCMFVKDV
jgi:ribosomal protein S18 acetylase RimI-like enzyme